MGVDLDLAGIHTEVKLLFGEKLVPVAVHKKKENAFDFCIIQFSQSYCFYLAIYVFTEMCRIQKLICSFGNVTDQTEDAREATIVSWLS